MPLERQELRLTVTMFRSVGALIVDDQNRLLLQKRDNKQSIYFPDSWGTFGGACESDELPETAIVREIKEELEVKICRFDLFLKLHIEAESLGVEPRERFFFSTYFSPKMVKQMSQREGAGYRFFYVEELPHVSKLVPFDIAAIILFTHAKLVVSQITPQRFLCAD